TLALLVSERRHVNVPKLSGVAPTPAALEKQNYAHFKTLSLAFPAARTEGVARFIEFLASKPARKILTATGHSLDDVKAAK
ncbi:hypothetical protein, partial [Priestia megaterium]|uniref:hypothetical protein n=1 Tax=Priestia megaterium TaxID=1404 RepID=UPI0035B5776F